MSETITAAITGKALPIDSLEMDFTYDGDNISTASVQYQDITYIQTFTYTEGNLTSVSQWVPQS